MAQSMDKKHPRNQFQINACDFELTYQGFLIYFQV